jgi:hypothetical protein
MEEEIWKEIPGFHGRYEASNIGRIRSLYRYINKRKIPLILKQVDSKGYRRLSLVKDGIHIVPTVHSLVMLTFIGDRPEGYHINHIDGNKANNKLSNLEYVTPSENIKHSFRVCGKKPNITTAKLVEHEVVEIKRMFDTHKISEIASKFKVHPRTIRDIKRNISWKNVHG